MAVLTSHKPDGCREDRTNNPQEPQPGQRALPRRQELLRSLPGHGPNAPPGLVVGTEGLGPAHSPRGSPLSLTYVAARWSSRKGPRGVPNVLGKSAERLPRHLDPLGPGVDDSPSEPLQAGGVVGPVEGKTP